MTRRIAARRGRSADPEPHARRPRGAARWPTRSPRRWSSPRCPTIQRDYGVDAADATWLLTAFLLTAVRRHAAPRPPRRHVRQGAPAARSRSASSAPATSSRRSAGSLGVLIAGRAIQGAGGAIFPLAIGIIRDEFPREKVATGIGTISAMFGIGGGVGPRHRRRARRRRSASTWIFWLERVAAASWPRWATWRYVPESPVRVRGAHRLGRRGAAVGRRSARCCSASARATRGAGRSAGVLGLFAGAVVLGRGLGLRSRTAHARTRSSTCGSCAGGRCGRRTSSASRSASRCSARSSSSRSSCRRRRAPATASARASRRAGCSCCRARS